jgi:urea transporter
MLVGFIDELLRGFGQVMFQNSPLTGLLFMIGLFIGGAEIGFYALLGTAVSTLTAHLFGVPISAIKAGVFGYNGALVGVALTYYLADNVMLPFYVVGAASVSAIVAAALGNVLSTWQLPALTGPFVATTGLFALGIYGFNQLAPAAGSPLPTAPMVTSGSRAALDGMLIWEGLFRGISQVFLQNGVLIGAIFLLGILSSSRIDGLMAAVGSAVGLLVGWVLGIDAGSLALGLMGYNAALTMMALGGLFYILDRHSVILALLAAATSVVVTVALSASVAPFGGNIYTAPFLVTSWVFIAAKPFLRQVQAVPPVDATTPEGNLNLYRITGHWWERSSEAERGTQEGRQSQ